MLRFIYINIKKITKILLDIHCKMTVLATFS
jgi:hypothetical protein